MESSKTYLLSILVPTKNRYGTLLHLIDYLSTLDDKLVEIVIQDNSDDNSNHLKKLNNLAKKDNFRYFYSKENLSVVENFDKGLLNCSGEYICSIGDDDAVMPYILKIVKCMKKNDIEILNSYKPTYYWPKLQSSLLSSDTSGILKIKKFNKTISTLQSQKILNEVFSRGCSTMHQLPSIYHGIVKKSLLNEIYNECTTFFPGSSPDMANAVALTKYYKKYYYVNYPIFISGKSVNSTSGLGVMHRHIARIEDVEHLPAVTKKRWYLKIPRFWTGPSIWAQSAVEALNFTKRKELISKINFNYLNNYLIVHNFKMRRKIFNKKIPYNPNYLLKIIISRIIIFLENRNPFVVKKYYGVENITSAVNIIEKQVNE